MVELAGHFGMAVLFAAPAWIVWGRRGALGFTAFALATAMLPDVDLALRHVLPITHHGVTHTLVFVLSASVLAGAFAARWLTSWFNAHSRIRSNEIAGATVFVFATAGLTVGGVSHLFADVLSADATTPLSPFWPFYSEPVLVDVIDYDAPVWNVRLITAAGRSTWCSPAMRATRSITASVSAVVTTAESRRRRRPDRRPRLVALDRRP